MQRRATSVFFLQAIHHIPGPLQTSQTQHVHVVYRTRRTSCELMSLLDSNMLIHRDTNGEVPVLRNAALQCIF